MSELAIEGLRKSYGHTLILNGVDLSIKSGSLLAVLGASGSGKTTLLRLIAGFERPDTGNIIVDGKLLSSAEVHVPPERRRIGYVTQDGALFPHLTVADNILFGLPRSERRARQGLSQLLDMVGLPLAFAEREPHQLSGGEQQRVALARALAPRPSLVLLDEPFSALDAALRIETRRVVADALSAAGATALLVTHDQPEALSMGDVVAVLRDGRLVQASNPRDVYRLPADTETAQFVGDAVMLEGTAKDGRVLCALGTLTVTPGMPEGIVDVLIRPEQIRLVPFRYGAGVWAKVVAVTFFGPDAVVRLNATQNESEISFIARVAGHRAPKAGDEVSAVVEGEVVTYAARA